MSASDLGNIDPSVIATAKPALIPSGRSTRERRLLILFKCLGVVLLVAACLKTHQAFAKSSIDGIEFVDVPLIIAEASYGLWLTLTRLYRRITWCVTTALFTTFAIVSLYKTFRGAGSCGCFGEFSFSPVLSVIVNSTICVALVSLGDYVFSTIGTYRSLKIAMAGFVVIGPLLVLAIYQSQSAEDSARSLLEPYDSWIGKPFRPLELISFRDAASYALDSPSPTTVVFLRPGCPACQELLRDMEANHKAIEAARRLERQDIVLLLVEIADHPSQKPLSSANPRAISGHISAELGKYITTPLVVEIRDHVVRNVHSGPVTQ